MQLYRVDPTDKQDLFIVVPANAPDQAKDLNEVGAGVLQSLLFTGFFAWAGADGKMNLFIIGPTLCNALFDASFMSMDNFADKFSKAYNIPQWSKVDGSDGNQILLYESSGGPSLALTNDDLNRRTLVVWNSISSFPGRPANRGAFD
jgi:hypothetical protein